MLYCNLDPVRKEVPDFKGSEHFQFKNFRFVSSHFMCYKVAVDFAVECFKCVLKIKLWRASTQGLNLNFRCSPKFRFYPLDVELLSLIDRTRFGIENFYQAVFLRLLK